MISPELVEKAMEQIRKRGANHEYFFAKLSSPAWITPLAEKGFFREPPGVLREGDRISFPFWPEGQYLARMAREAPELVLNVMEAVPETDNPRVHEHLCEAAIAMPGPLATRWAAREARWISKQAHLYLQLPMRFGELAAHLAGQGERDAALGLLRSLLKIRMTPGSAHSGALFDVWTYEEILRKRVPSVLAADPVKVLRMLCGLLVDALNTDDRESNPPEDYSWIWRPAIENHPQNRGDGDLRDALVSAVRDSAMRIFGEQWMVPTDVARELAAHPWFVFQRITLHVLAENLGLAPLLAREKVLSRSALNAIQLNHEYSRMLRVVFPLLSETEQAEVLEWIEAPLSAAPDVSSDGRDREVLRRLTILEGQLPPPWQLKLNVLRSRFGAAEHPEFHAFMKTGVGPTSPLERDALRAKAPAELATFCAEWVPGDSWMSPTREGLAREIQADVARRVPEYVAALDRFQGTDPTYARAVVQGLSEGAKAKTELQWAPVLEFLAWIVSQERELSGRSGEPLDEDPHWGWARRATAGLISVACEGDYLPGELRDDAWKIIEVLAADPDPTLADDQKSGMSPADRSINSTRGESLHAVVRFALWEHRRSETSRERTVMASDIRKLLDEHLDPSKDASLAVRAVYGRWLPWLILLDREWAVERLAMIFPEAPGEAGLRAAAWETYVTFCPVFDDAFLVLEPIYAKAVGWLSDNGAPKRRSRGHEEALGEHLVLLVARGRLAWGDANELVRSFFRRATAEVSEHALKFVGRLLRNDEHPPSDEAVRRLGTLWDRVVEESQNAGSPAPSALRAFGWWFASCRFEAAWAFKNLLDALKRVGHVDAAFLVFEALEQTVESYPVESVEVLRELVRSDRDNWEVLGSEPHIRVVLSVALRAPEATEGARQAIHELGARGHLEFGQLLAQQS